MTPDEARRVEELARKMCIERGDDWCGGMDWVKDLYRYEAARELGLDKEGQ